MRRPRHILRDLPKLDTISPDTPLRLDVAAILAYPDGSMTASGLRREVRRGRLVIERVAGKDYVTLAAIDQMRKLCRLEAKAHDYGCDLSEKTPPGSFVVPLGSSETPDTTRARDALHTTLAALKKHSPAISPRSTPSRRPESATVTPLPSR
jgi:hypothetical protein